MLNVDKNVFVDFFQKEKNQHFSVNKTRKAICLFEKQNLFKIKTKIGKKKKQCNQVACPIQGMAYDKFGVCTKFQ